MEAPKCPKCEGNMEEGYMLDYTDYGILQGQWRTREGVDRKVLFGFKSIPQPKTQLQVTTFRCVKCGFLESYALPKES